MTAKKIFITGAGGMLGSALMRHHAVNGHTVRGYDVFSHMASVHVGDIRDGTALTRAMMDFAPDRVYHCAAMLGVKNTEDHPAICREINENATMSVYQAAMLSGATEFVFTSSSEVYGDVGDARRIAEWQPLDGNNVYALGKIAAERYLLSKTDDMKIVIARMFNCFGLGQVKQFLVPKLVGQFDRGETPALYGDPNNVRSYLYAQDAATYLCHIGDRAKNGEVINVASGEDRTLHNVVHTIAAAFEKPIVPHYEVIKGDDYPDRKRSRDIPNRLADITRLRQLSTYAPTRFDDAVSRVVRYREGLRDGWVYSMERFT